RRCGRRTENCGARRRWACASSTRAPTSSRSRSCGARSTCRPPVIRSAWASCTGWAARSRSRASGSKRATCTAGCSPWTSDSGTCGSAPRRLPRRNNVSQQVVPVALRDLQRPVAGELERVADELGRIIAADFPIIAEVNEHLVRMKGELFRLDDREPLRVFARVTNEMTIGEMRQLEAHDKLAYSEDQYDQLIRAKTASLLSGACEVGALQGPKAYREALARFGMRLGMAFQIADDLLDYTAAEAVTGKPSGLDLREHTVTLPLIAALGAMPPADRRLVAELMAAPEPADALVAEVVRCVASAGGLDYARRRALELAQQADAELDILPMSPARDALRDSIAYAVERRS